MKLTPKIEAIKKFHMQIKREIFWMPYKKLFDGRIEVQAVILLR